MDEILLLVIPAVLAPAVLRLMLLPMRFFWKAAIHTAAGFCCLWLLNTVSGFTGVYFPINAVTVLVAGAAGLPGIGLMAALTVL